MATYKEARIQKLLQNPGIVRNKLKVRAFVSNAQAYLEVQKEFGSFREYIWSFVDQEPIRYDRPSMKDVPATSPESDAMSKDLKKRGFKFVGSTICYAYMQACGMVDDHIDACAFKSRG